MKFTGVITMEAKVDRPDRLTDSAALPCAMAVRKLDTFPPGQAASSNKPSAMLADGCKTMMQSHANDGSSRN